MIKLLLAAVIAATPVAAAPESAPPAQLSLDEALTICRTVYLGDPKRGKARFEAVPPAQKQAVAILCLGYGLGLQDGVQSTPIRPENNS